MNRLTQLLKLGFLVASLTLAISHNTVAAESEPKFEITRTPAAFDRTKNVFFSYVKFKNITSQTIKGPFAINVNDSSIPVVNGKPYQSGNQTKYFFELTGDVPAGEAKTLRIDFKAIKAPITYQLRLDFRETYFSIPASEKIDAFSITPKLVFTNSDTEITFQADSQKLSRPPVHFIAAKLDDAGNELTWNFMNDSGWNGDAVAGDGTYTSTSPLPATDINHAHKERYKIKAVYIVGKNYTQTLQSYTAYDDYRYVDGEIREIFVEKPPFYDTEQARGTTYLDGRYLVMADEVMFTLGENLSSDEAYAIAEAVATDHGGKLVGYSPHPSIFTLRFNTCYSCFNAFDQSQIDTVASDPHVEFALPNVIPGYASISDLSDMRATMGRDVVKNHIVAPYETMKMFQAWDWLESNLQNQKSLLRKVNVGVAEHVDNMHHEISSFIKIHGSQSTANLDQFDHGTAVAGLIGASHSGPNKGVTGARDDICPQIYCDQDQNFFTNYQNTFGDPSKWPGPINGVLSGASSSTGDSLIDYEMHAPGGDFSQQEIYGTISRMTANYTPGNIVSVINYSRASWLDTTPPNPPFYNGCSPGTSCVSQSTFDNLRKVWERIFEYDRDFLFVVAAGNQGADADSYTLPAGIEKPNVLTVTSTNISGKNLSAFSNFGSTVDIAAPGENIYFPIAFDTSGAPNYGINSGTSFSAPFVAGTAGLLTAISPLTNGRIPIGGQPEAKAIREALLENANVTLVDKPMGDSQCATDPATGQCLKDAQGNDLYHARVLDACTPLATAMHTNHIDDLVPGGRVVAVHGRKIAIASSSGIHIYDTDTEKTLAIISDPELANNPSAATHFGRSVDMDDHHVLVGSPGNNKAYLFDLGGNRRETYDMNMLSGKVWSIVDETGQLYGDIISSPFVFGAGVKLDGDDIYIYMRGFERESPQYRLINYYLQLKGSQIKIIWKNRGGLANTVGQLTADVFDLTTNLAPHVKGGVIRNSLGYYNTTTRNKVPLAAGEGLILGDSHHAIVDASHNVTLLDNSGGPSITPIDSTTGKQVNIGDWGGMMGHAPFLHGTSGLFIKDGIVYARDFKTGQVRKSFKESFGDLNLLGNDMIAIPGEFDYASGTQKTDRLIFLCPQSP
ncbi:S8 family serine peptidase [Methylococcus sp. EFPC2]|uniref:S8 family serine peptidase n=1 Tax=Methylococcus sp. EFPC2 TaxID=2812648 RepID=UPI001967E210|nr:S8 family serine peptidase [Methylococcus sp. EFPC2]QSA95651.1 S8 family serine peptidase [Methylococcus sp. EFPC2]